MRALIKDSSDTSKRLLPGSVPNLELNNMLIVNSHNIVSKFHTDGDVVLVIELVVN